MELKTGITTLFIIFFLLATPYISRGGSDVGAESDIYEIDYRGPETHSSVIPPPGHVHGRPWIHRQGTKATPKSNGSRGGNNGENANKIHG